MISFVYITCRKDPKLEWFIDALYNQIKINNFDINKIQIVIVDYELQYDKDNLRKYMIEKIINNRFDFIHIPPKPSNIQGIYKLTKINYFSCSLARNTGICYVKYDYVAFIDDLSTFEEGSFDLILNFTTESKFFHLLKPGGHILMQGEILNGKEYYFINNLTFSVL